MNARLKAYVDRILVTILERNPLDTPPDEIGAIEVLATWLDGRPTAA